MAMDHIWSCAAGIGKVLLGRIPAEFDYIWSYENYLKELEEEVQRLKDTQLVLQHRVDEARNNLDEIEDLVERWQKGAESTFDEAQKVIETEEARWCLGKCPNLCTRNWMSKKFEEMKEKISQRIQNGNFERISYCKRDHVLSYNNNLEVLKIEFQKLEDTKVKMQLGIAEAERNGEKIEEIVKNWLEKANDTIAKATKLIDHAAGAAKCSNTREILQTIERLEEMKKLISQVIENGKFDRLSYRVATDVTSSPSERGYESLKSRTSILNEIKKALKDPKMYKIGVYGMGGVGKTTLVNELAWQVNRENLFDVVAIADITQSPDVKKIQGQIADALKLELKSETETGRAGELRERISQENLVLIILDDIWSELSLEKVGIPVGDKCKLVMTSRDLNLLQRMETNEEFYLKALQEEDSWILFKKMAGDVVEKVNIKPIAEKLVKCCTGFPLLIVVVGKGLRKKNDNIWRDALTRLERLDHEELKNKVYPTLELSYNWLENEALKSLFLFIGSFELNGISIEEMILCCWGLGFYGHVYSLAEARDRHYKLINDLRASSLLFEADGEPGRIIMHDVVRDVAKSIAFKLHPTYAVQRKTKLEEWSNLDFLKCHYIMIPSSYIGRELPEKLECPKLKILLLQNIGDYNLEVPTDLVNLPSFSLYKCSLEDINMPAKLTNLEIFIMKDSNIKEPIPTHSFAKLNAIRVQGIRGSKNLALFNPQVVMPNLGTLILNTRVCKIWDDKLPVLLCFQNLTFLEVIHCIRLRSLFPSMVVRALVRLQHLEISQCKMLEKIFVQEQEVQFPNLETLLISHMSSLRTIWPNKSVAPNSFSKLKKIKIEYCTSLEYVFPTLVAREFRRLRYLTIDECGVKNIVEKSDSISDMTLVYLEKLTISECHKIETIVPSYVLFQTLDELEVNQCGYLDNIISPSTTTNLPKLRVLTVGDCYRLRTIYGSNNEGEAPVAEIVFEKLEELTLRYLEGLKSFCEESYDFNFPSLPMIFLINCFKMETFSHGNLMTPRLTKVKLMWIENLDEYGGTTYWQDYFGDIELQIEQHWYKDLNTTVRTIYTKKTTECGSD